MSEPADDTLRGRVAQFQALELPGQPMGMHMGTMYLVNDLWREVQTLRAASKVENNRTGEASAPLDIVNIKSSDPGTVAVASGPTAEDIRACARSTLLGFQHELGDSIDFICDQIARKATMPAVASGAPSDQQFNADRTDDSAMSSADRECRFPNCDCPGSPLDPVCVISSTMRGGAA